MRDYSRLDGYLTSLYGDVYEQSEDAGHTLYARLFLEWISDIPFGSVLDVGCGNGFCQNFLKGHAYTGVGMGEDIQAGKAARRNVIEMDYNFLDFDNNSFDLILSRHSLEHSPFPLLTLMEWHRVAGRWLALCFPNPEYYTFLGRNHYSVSYASQLAWWMRRAGWKIRKAKWLAEEYWFVAEKKPILGYEGWAEVPLPGLIYEFERDIFDSYYEIDTDGLF